LSTKDKAIMAVALFALALVGAFVFIEGDSLDAVDADPIEVNDVDIVIDADKGVMTLTVDGALTPADVKTVTDDMASAYYAISMEGMVEELTIVTLTYYEAVKPYINANNFFVVSIAEVDEMGNAQWASLLNALDHLEVDINAVITVIETPTPVAVKVDGQMALEEAVAAVTEAKDAIIEQLNETIGTMFTAEQVEEAVAAAVADLYTEEQVQLMVEEAVMEVLANLSDYKYTDADMQKAVADAIAGVYKLYLTDEQIKAVSDAIAEKDLELKKAVARMDITQEEADKLLKAFTIEAYRTAIASEFIDAKDKIIAQKDAEIEDLKKQLDDATKSAPPLWEQGIGQCMIIIIAFLVVLVVWVLYKGGYLNKLFKTKTKTNNGGNSE